LVGLWVGRLRYLIRRAVGEGGVGERIVIGNGTGEWFRFGLGGGLGHVRRERVAGCRIDRALGLERRLRFRFRFGF
jgi:hypothetical protein